MKEDNIIQEKSFDFALRAIKVYKVLQNERKEYILSKQFLRSSSQ
jgi:four helix bundle protein